MCKITKQNVYIVYIVMTVTLEYWIDINTKYNYLFVVVVFDDLICFFLRNQSLISIILSVRVCVFDSNRECVLDSF